MDPITPDNPPTRSRAPLGWGGAVLLVVLIWAAAVVMRHGGPKAELTGWAEGLEAGQIKAEEMDRPMVVLFTASWCPPCQRLKKDVLSKPEVVAALEARFVPVQVDMSNASRGDPVVQMYGIEGYPTVLALNPKGEPIGQFTGERSVAGFTAWLDQLDR